MRYYTEDYLRTEDGAELWHAVLGEGEPALVMCDGLGCAGFAWKHLIRHLVPQHRILRFNYRGHGRSSLATEPERIGIGYFADDLARLLEATKIRQAVILGHSMGVQVAFEFHRRHPERCLALVPICGSYGNPLDTVHDNPGMKALFPFLVAAVEKAPRLSRGLTKAIMPSELAYQFARFTEINRHLVRREDFEPYFSHLAQMDVGVFLRTLESAANHTAWDHLGKVDVPTLIVAADHDRFTPMWLSERMHHAVPDSEMLVVRSGTHTAIIEMPELIALRIERFLKERLAPRQAA